MRIAILSRGATLYSTQRLAEAGRQCGHEVFILDTMQVAQHIGILSMPGPRRPLPTALDAMIPRIGALITMFGVAVVRHLQRRGLLTTADADGILNSRDKRRSWRLMADAGLPLPRTALLSEQTGLAAAARQVGGPPLVIKLLQGTQGQGVILARDMATARNVLRVLNRYGIREVLIQEFVAEAEGRDWRLIVIGDRCVAAMQRQAPVGEFRANLHRGASARRCRPATTWSPWRFRLLRYMGRWQGLMSFPRIAGPCSWRSIRRPACRVSEKTTGVDVADATIAYLGPWPLSRRRS